MKYVEISRVLQNVWMDYPNQAGSLHGTRGVNCDSFGGRDEPVNWFLHVFVYSWLQRVIVCQLISSGVAAIGQAAT